MFRNIDWDSVFHRLFFSVAAFFAQHFDSHVRINHTWMFISSRIVLFLWKKTHTFLCAFVYFVSFEKKKQSGKIQCAKNRNIIWNDWVLCDMNLSDEIHHHRFECVYKYKVSVVVCAQNICSTGNSLRFCFNSNRQAKRQATKESTQRRRSKRWERKRQRGKAEQIKEDGATERGWKERDRESTRRTQRIQQIDIWKHPRNGLYACKGAAPGI